MKLNFKLTNKSKVLLTAGVFLIALISLSMVQLQQVQARSRTEKETAQTNLLIEKLNIDGLVAQKAKLQSGVEQATVEASQAKDSLKQSLETIESSGDIYDIAAKSNVHIDSIDSSMVSEKDIGGVKCAVLQVTVKASGTTNDLINFVSQLTAEYHTGAVTSVRINMGNAGSSDNTSGTPIQDNTPQITVNLTIYDYRGG